MPNLDYARSDNYYTGLPVDEIKSLNSEASQQYQNTRNAKDALDVMYNSLDLRDVDAPIKKKAIDDARSRLSQVVSDGNYQDAGYVVSQAVKDFKTNNELRDALKSRQKEVEYHTDLKKKLDEGKITPDAYKYGVSISKINNSNPLQYNPDTFTSDNIFSGHNVLDDKSKEIYDTTYKRIADWKASSTPMTIDGRTFKLDKVKGIAYDMQTGEEVKESEVFDALKKEVEKSYAPNLQQERDIENFKKFYDSNTGKLNSPERSDIPLVDEDIKTMLSGISDKGLASLKSKAELGEKGAKLAYESALKQRDSINLNDPKIIQQAYLQFQKKNQIDNYVYPATAKAGYLKLNHTLFDDEAAKLALQHQYKKSEIEYEKTFTAPLPTSNSQLEEFTGVDYQKAIDDENKIKDELNTSNQRLEEAKKSGNSTYIQNAQKEVERLTHLNETAQNRQLDFVKGLASKDPRVAKEYVISNIKDVINEIKNNPGKYSSALNGEVAKIEGASNRDTRKNYVSVGISSAGVVNSSPVEKSWDEKLRLNARENLNTLYNQIEKEKNKNDLLKTAINSTSRNYTKVPSNILDSIEEAKRANKGFGISYQTNVLGIDPNSDKAWERPIIDRVADLVKNTATNWMIGDTSLDQIASGEADGFEFENEAGKTTKPDLTKSEVRPQFNHISGLNTVRVLFKDSDGKPLYRDGDKKSQAAVTLTPSDQEGLSTVYKQLGQTLKESADGNAQKQGVKILGYTKFAPSMSSVYLSNMNDGEEKNLVIPSSQGELYTKIKKGTGGFEAYIRQGDKYVPFTLSNYNKKSSNTFGSKEQFEELLELNGY